MLSSEIYDVKHDAHYFKENVLCIHFFFFMVGFFKHFFQATKIKQGDESGDKSALSFFSLLQS